MEITLHEVTCREEKIKMEDFIHEHFFPDMPLIQAFGIGHCPPPRPSVPMSGPGDFYVKATDSQGQTIGVAVNRSSPHLGTDSDTPPRVQKGRALILQKHHQHITNENEMKKSRAIEMVELLKFAEEEADLGQLPERTIELRILSVAKEWRRRGVARRLAEESMRLAKEAGFVAMRVCCTSEYTARLVRRLGWREHYRLSYKDYPTLSETDVHMIPVPGHEYLYYYVVQL